MELHRGHSQCAHDGYHSGLGVYSRESEQLRYVMVCDDCGAEVREVSIETYVPNPLFETAA
jgi:hypothetical protein